MTERTCRRCGCTQECACFDDLRGSCSWAEDDLCSHCADTLRVLAEFELAGADEAGSFPLDAHHLNQVLKMLRYTPAPAEPPAPVDAVASAPLRRLVGAWLRFNAIEDVLISFSDGIEYERLEAALGWATHGGRPTEPLLDLFAAPQIAARSEGEWEGSDEDAIREGKATIERADSPAAIDSIIVTLGLAAETPKTPAAPGGVSP